MNNKFNGFTKRTITIFNEIKYNNNRLYFNEIKDEYNLYVKSPLIELYNQLIGPLMTFDDQIDYRLSKCISSPYADARFCRSNPIKEYIYLRFKLMRDRKTDIPGFYFDASADLARFGIKLYNATTNGMVRIKDYIMKNKKSFEKAILGIENKLKPVIEGKPFKKEHYPEYHEPVKKWLNFRDINVYCELKNYDLFFKPELANTINETFNCVKPLFKIMKTSLDVLQDVYNEEHESEKI
jgi:uncharacterized protein (DUF2461 family)